MTITLDSGSSLKFIGDPHFGKKFEIGVPLHRRGEREAEQLIKLILELATPCDFNICVGDVFDGPHASHAVVTTVAEAYRDAARARPLTTFLIMAGNHDLAKAVGARGAWLSLKLMVEDVPNIIAIDKPYAHPAGFTLFPWDWSVSAEDQTAGVVTHPVVVGHWDLQSFGGDDSHLCPAQTLTRLGATRIVSGHYHLPGTYVVDGIDVECTGSMLPYSHAEDPNGDIYVTMSLVDLEMTHPDVIKNKCVRVLLEPGEVLPSDIDCRALTAKRLKAEKEDIEITTGDFDWATTLSTALAPLQPYVREFISERLTT